MADNHDQEPGLTAEPTSLVFKVRALAQAHPLSNGAHRYLNQLVARESDAQPQREIGAWAGYGLTVGYCLRRIEEVEILGSRSEASPLSFEEADRLSSRLTVEIRTAGADGRYLMSEDIVVTTLDDLIAGEIERRLDQWKGTVPKETWRELEEYIAWWVIKGYALRIVETIAVDKPGSDVKSTVDGEQ